MSLAWLIARRHHLSWLLLLAVGEVLALRTVRGRFGVPGRGDGVEWVLGPLLPSLPALVVPAMAAVVLEEPERIAPVPAVARRGLVVAAHLVVILVTTLLGSFGVGEAAILARNGLLFASLALSAAVLMPEEISWSPVVVAATTTWIVGVPEPGSPVPRWAILLQSGSAVGPWVFTLVLTLAATAFYIGRERPVTWGQWRAAGSGRAVRGPAGTSAPRRGGTGCTGRRGRSGRLRGPRS